MKNGCHAWFDLLDPHSPMENKGVFATLWGGDNTKVFGTNSLSWESICNEFSEVFEKPNSPLERAIKHDIDFLPDFVLLVKS